MHKSFGTILGYFDDFSPKTAGIEVTVLVISGTRDYAIAIDHPEIMRFPICRWRMWKVGHALYPEHSKELYDRVSAFLKKYAN